MLIQIEDFDFRAIQLKNVHNIVTHTIVNTTAPDGACAWNSGMRDKGHGRLYYYVHESFLKKTV